MLASADDMRGGRLAVNRAQQLSRAACLADVAPTASTGSGRRECADGRVSVQEPEWLALASPAASAHPVMGR